MTPETTRILMIDHARGFLPLFRSHAIPDHVNAAVAVAKTAHAYGVPLTVTHGKDADGPGPIFEPLRAELREEEIVRREGTFDALASPAVRSAVAGAENLVLTGLMTEGCVLQTALSAVRLGHRVHVVEDAVAAETELSHRAAMTRMAMAGVIPTTWLSLASEFQRGWDNLATVAAYTALIRDHAPILGAGLP
ncbi:MAG: isochorismatase family protein [Nonomuraea sp.]|nr:isochorismatase family protein [Nonomuraea sp.]